MCTAGQRVLLTITGPGPSFPSFADLLCLGEKLNCAQGFVVTLVTVDKVVLEQFLKNNRDCYFRPKDEHYFDILW